MREVDRQEQLIPKERLTDCEQREGLREGALVFVREMLDKAKADFELADWYVGRCLGQIMKVGHDTPLAAELVALIEAEGIEINHPIIKPKAKVLQFDPKKKRRKRA